MFLREKNIGELLRFVNPAGMSNAIFKMGLPRKRRALSWMQGATLEEADEWIEGTTEDGHKHLLRPDDRIFIQY